MGWQKIKETLRVNHSRWTVIYEVNELLNQWRDDNDDTKRLEAIRILQEAR